MKKLSLIAVTVALAGALAAPAGARSTGGWSQWRGHRQGDSTVLLSFKRARAAIRRSWSGWEIRIGRCSRDSPVRITCSDRVWIAVSVNDGPTSYEWLRGADAAFLHGTHVRVVALGATVGVPG